MGSQQGVVESNKAAEEAATGFCLGFPGRTLLSLTSFLFWTNKKTRQICFLLEPKRPNKVE